MDKEKRTTIPLYPPWFYEIEPLTCPHCGSKNLTWSEYKHYIACNDCQKDIKPTFDGFLDGGPTPVVAAAMFGIRFDILNLETNKVEYCDLLPLPHTREWKEIKNSLNGAINSVIIGLRFKLIDDIYKKAFKNNLIEKNDKVHQDRKEFIKELFNGKRRNQSN